MFSLKVSLNGASEQTATYNDSLLLILVCVWEHLSWATAFRSCPHISAHALALDHIQKGPVTAQRLGNIGGVMRTPNVLRAARCHKSSLDDEVVPCGAQWHGALWRGNLRGTCAVPGQGGTTTCNEPAALSRDRASCSVFLLLFIFSWVKLVAALVLTEPAQCVTYTVEFYTHL